MFRHFSDFGNGHQQLAVICCRILENKNSQKLYIRDITPLLFKTKGSLTSTPYERQVHQAVVCLGMEQFSVCFHWVGHKRVPDVPPQSQKRQTTREPKIDTFSRFWAFRLLPRKKKQIGSNRNASFYDIESERVFPLPISACMVLPPHLPLHSGRFSGHSRWSLEIRAQRKADKNIKDCYFASFAYFEIVF